MDLLNQFEQILEHDPLIDEIGFIHQSQFVKLNENAGISEPSPSEAPELDVSEPEDMRFWNRDHKLGISTLVLLPLYRAAKDAFMAALKQYKLCIGGSERVRKANVDLCNLRSSRSSLEGEVMRHSKALLLLSCDFGTAWNSRKLVLTKQQGSATYMDELHLSTVVLSYSPKSDYAWSHRRWAIRMISGECSNLQEIVDKESELVENVAERSKMNYRAWNHRCQLVAYMKQKQVQLELEKSRTWASLHVADNCCFHYRRRLLGRLLDAYYHKEDIYELLKEELDWNKMLLERYIGREALWLHRRFLSVCWLRHLSAFSYQILENSKNNYSTSNHLDSELQLLLRSTVIPDDSFEDFQAQATLSATYMLWLIKEISDSERIELQEKLRPLELKALLMKASPEKSLLWNNLMEFNGTI